jgi:polyhydroxybutyrate depolymerase
MKTASLFLGFLVLALHAEDAASPGNHTVRLEHQGRKRSYIVHVPPQAVAKKPLPVVIAYHGGGGNAQQFQESCELDRLADRDGFLLVYPNGTGRLEDRLLTWNAGKGCGYAMENRVDDVGFSLAVLDDLARRNPVEARRVYATGMSNGSMMAYRLATDAADRVTAIVGVAGAMNVETFAPSRPVSILHIHSVDDPRAPYPGGLGPPFPLTNVRTSHSDVDATLHQWIVFNGCPEKPVVGATIHGKAGTPSEKHTATCYTWGPGKNGVKVVFWKLTGAGHVWPGAEPGRIEKIVGPSTDVIDANELIEQFFLLK